MAASGAHREVAPWTVVMQGSALSYEDATFLDKLEFVLRAAPGTAALSQTLDQSGFLETATVRTCERLYLFYLLKKVLQVFSGFMMA